MLYGPENDCSMGLRNRLAMWAAESMGRYASRTQFCEVRRPSIAREEGGSSAGGEPAASLSPSTSTSTSTKSSARRGGGELCRGERQAPSTLLGRPRPSAACLGTCAGRWAARTARLLGAGGALPQAYPLAFSPPQVVLVLDMAHLPALRHFWGAA